MSVQAMAYVFDHETSTSGSERLVLLSLANHAREIDGRLECYPGIDRIAREAGIARVETVREALRRLEGKGLIVRVVNGAPDQRIRGDRRPNLYLLTLDDHGGTDSGYPSNHHGSPDSGSTGTRETGERVPAKRAHGSPDSGYQTVSEPREEPSEEPSREPLPSLPSVASSALVVFGSMADEVTFDHFWREYPIRVGKEAARRAFAKALKRGVDPDVIIGGASRYAADPNRDPSYTAHPATWLNAGRWSDDPLPRRNGGKVGGGDLMTATKNLSDDQLRAKLGLSHG